MSADALAREEQGQSAASVPRRPAPARPLPAGTAAEATLDLVTTRGGFDALEASWNALFARAGRDIHLFQTFNWLWHWANHFLAGPGEAGPRLAIVTARVDGRLVMVWPLVSERVGPLTRLAWMGAPVSQYGDVLIDDMPDAPELLRAAWDFVTRRTGAAVVQMRKVRQDSNIAPLLGEIGARVIGEATAPYLDLAGVPSFDALVAQHSGDARRNRKRQRRRLADRGAVALHWHTEGAEAEALAAAAFAYKAAWLEARGLVSPALADPRTARFFADVARADTRPAGCHVIALSSGGHPAAIEIGVRCKGRSAIHVVTYDLAWEKTAAGALLMEDSIRRACDDGMAVFDFLAPADGYKRAWSDTAVVVRDWAVPLTAAGRPYAALYLGVLRSAVKRGIDALPLAIRRKLTGALTA